MWHRQKKSQNEENSVPVVPVKPSQAPAIPPKSGEKKSFKKRILQFSGLTSAHNVEGKLSAAEIKRLEETKNRLFKQGGAKSPERDPNDPLRSPLKTLTASPNQISQPSSSSTSPRSDMSSDLTYSLPKTFNIPNLSLPALESVQIKARDVVLHRNVAGDFGFTIRRIQYPLTTENGTEISHLVFAEPVDHLNGPPRPSDLLNGLLPGDQLLQVEGRDVNRLKRDELLSLIQEAGQSIRLRVQVVPELAELATKTAVSGDQLQLFSQFKETDLNIPEDKRYWLVHSAGYSLVEVVDHQPDGLVKIKVADQEMTVDSSDLDKANPPNFDRANDIAALKNINETSAIHLLRNRLGSGLQYTSAGPRNLIYMASQSQEIKGLNQDLIRLFKGCRRSQMPAHIYTTAQQVYRQLQITSRPQSVVFNGVSGSGKSQQIRNFIEFLCGCAGWTKRLTYEEISLAIGILEAFGNCSTELNQNSSRFVQLISLGFDTASGLNSAKIQTLFLDLEKLTSRKPTDSTFHIFYYLWEGLDTKTFESLGFDLIDRPFFDENLSETDRNAASEAFHRVLEAFRNLNFSENQILAVQKVLAAILHLIYSGAQGNLATKSAFTRHSNAEKAADLLGISFDQLNLAVFKGSQNFDQSSRYKLVNQTGNEALQSFVQALYNELFGAITNQINKYLNKSTAFTTISLLDIPGSTFLNSTSEPADLSDFIYNYYNERISELFYKSNFKSPLDLYEREKVEVEVERPLATPAHLCRLIDRKQQLLNSADVEKRSEEPRGIFFVLEEESVFPGANENSLIERVFMHWEESKLVRRSPKDRFQFNLGHGLNQFSVGYKVNGWLKKIKPSGAIFALTQVLQNTESPYISELFTVPGLKEGSYKLRRATQSVNEIVASVGGGGGSFGGFFTAITSQFDHLISLLERSDRLHFIHCLQSVDGTRRSDLMDVSLVRSQLRAGLIMDSVRATNRGYPERMPFRDFRRRFQCLVKENYTNLSLSDTLDDRSAVKKIFEKMQIFEFRYRLGISQVLVRSDVLAELEEKRDLCLSGVIEAFQRECRLHLSRKWLEKRRIQEQAITCLQRNLSQYLKLREWPWWKLFVRVVPLLGVARADENEKQWKQQLQKLESQNSELKQSRNQMDEQLRDIENLLKTECQTSQNLANSLERESAMRVRLEAEIRHLKTKLVNLESEDEKREKVMSGDYEWSAKKPSPDPGLACELDRLREQDTSQRMKIQKLTENLNDFKEEIENLRARNEVLEKKGSNVDDEIGVFQERINRLEAEKSRVEQELKEVSASLNKKSSELHEIREQNSELRTQMTRTKRELSEIAEDQGRTASESELSLLKKLKRDLEQKVSELEDELDEMVNKNDLLEQNVTRLNLNMDRMRSDNARETETREEELSELRAQHQRRVRTYEEQLADLTEANNNLQRQMKLLEQRSRQFETQSQYSYETVGSNNYKREFKKTAALLKDTQNLLAMERQKSDKAPLIRKLRLQLEEAEEAKLSAIRSKYSLENELAELNSEIENLRQAKKSLEDRVRDLLSDKAAAVSTSKDLEEQLNSVLRDYRNAVLQTENDSRLISQKAQMIAELEANKQDLTQQLAEAQSQVAYLKTHYVEAHKVTVLERSLVDLKSRIEFERAEKVKFEASSNRLQDEVDRLEDQLGELQRTLIKQQDMAVKHKRELSNEAEANRELRKREEEVASKYKKARDEIDQIQSEHAQTTSDLALALRRIDALQAALNANSDVDDDDERDDLTDDETEADVQSDALELNDSDVKKSEESSENGKVEHTQPITA